MGRGTGRAGFAQGRSLRVPGTGLVALRVAGGRTGGAYSLFEIGVTPGVSSCRHIQHREDECLLVLGGRFEIETGADLIEAGPGDLVYVPRGDLHGYRNVGAEAGRLMAVFTPGGAPERFFEEAASAEQGVPGFGALVEVAATHGIEIVGGPM